MNEPLAARLHQAALLLLVFCSGFAALVYQLVFIRQATLVFGATVDAVSTVVSAFVAGLAAGSVWGGRLADWIRSPLVAYGVVEGLVGVVSVASYVALRGVGGLYVAGVALAPASAGWAVCLRVVLAAAVILAPTFLMGASLPLVVRHAVRTVGNQGPVFSGLYGSNTLGAASGALLATYFLVPRLGVSGALAVAVALNLTVTLAVLLLRPVAARAPLESSAPAAVPLGARSVLLVAFFSGYLAFSLEVVWTHLLQLTVGGTAYVVGAILFVVLLGLGLGSAGLGWVLRNGRDPRLVLALALALTGLALAVHLPLWNRLPEAFPPLAPLRLGFVGREAVRFLLIAVAVLLPSTLMGAVFPLAVSLALHDPARIGRNIGRVYAVNAAGSIVGPLLAGFLVLPRLGSENTLRAHAVAYAALALAVLPRRLLARPTVVVAALAVALAVGLPRWDPRPFTSGANVYFTAGFRDYDRLLHFRESVHGGVTTVVEKGGARTLLTNGKFQGTTGPESSFQASMALVPLAVLRRHERALNIGLGTGQTLATLAAAPFRRIDVAEIAPDIVEAARRFFQPLHHGVLDDPRVHLEAVDGRNYLLVHPDARYDVIAVQLTSIWLAGAASLYSQEFYRLCRARLAPGGILQQWLQLHHMRWQDQLTVIATMASVFPQVAVWQFGHQAILLGSDHPLAGDYQGVLALEPKLREAGALAGFSTRRVLGVFAHHHLDDRAVRALLADAISAPMRQWFVSTDLRPLLEFGTPRGVSESASVARFYERTAAYSFTPLKDVLANIPPGEYAAALAVVNAERRGAVPQAVTVEGAR